MGIITARRVESIQTADGRRTTLDCAWDKLWTAGVRDEKGVGRRQEALPADKSG